MSKVKWYSKPMYLLVALALVLSLGIVAVPMAVTVEAQPADFHVIPFTLQTNATGTAQWDNTQQHTGSYSVELTTTNNGDYAAVAFMPVAGLGGYDSTINSITSLSYWYKCTAWDSWSGPRFSMLLDTDSNGEADHLVVSADVAGGIVDWTQWSPDFSDDTGVNRFWYGTCDATGGNYIQEAGPVSFGDVKTQFTGANVLSASPYLGVVTPGAVGAGTAYIDDPEVNGITYYGRIQDAIDAATGTTINVAAGTYTEAVTITPGADLIIQGAGRDVTTWIAPADDASRMHCIKCSNANDTTLDISGFTFSVEDNVISTGCIGIQINRATTGALHLSIHDNKFIETTTIPDETANSMLLCHNRFAARGAEAPVKIYNNLDYTTGGIAMSNTRAFDIYNNTFDGGSDALYIAYGCPENTTIGDHYIYNNTFKNASNAYPDGPWPSIFFDYHGSGTGMTFLPNTIEDNIFEDNDIAIGYSMESDITYPDDVIWFNDFNNNNEAMRVWGTYATAVDAENNWWGDASGPSGVGPGTGDAVSANVDYDPWLGAPVESSAVHQEIVGAGTHEVDASDEADTEVTLTTTGDTSVTIAKYESQPFPEEPFPHEALGKWIDIHVSNPGVVVWPIYVEVSYTDAEVAAAGIHESSLGLYYYEPVNTFHRCSDTGVNTVQNFIWANVTEAEAGYLVGTAFGAGGFPPPAPGIPAVDQWGVFAMITLFTGLLVWTVRRRQLTL